MSGEDDKYVHCPHCGIHVPNLQMNRDCCWCGKSIDEQKDTHGH